MNYWIALLFKGSAIPPNHVYIYLINIVFK